MNSLTGFECIKDRYGDFEKHYDKLPTTFNYLGKKAISDELMQYADYIFEATDQFTNEKFYLARIPEENMEIYLPCSPNTELI